MGETLLVAVVVVAAAAHLCYRYLPRRWIRKTAQTSTAGCQSGCGTCGGCPSGSARDQPRP